MYMAVIFRVPLVSFEGTPDHAALLLQQIDRVIQTHGGFLEDRAMQWLAGSSVGNRMSGIEELYLQCLDRLYSGVSEKYRSNEESEWKGI